MHLGTGFSMTLSPPTVSQPPSHPLPPAHKNPQEPPAHTLVQNMQGEDTNQQGLGPQSDCQAPWQAHLHPAISQRIQCHERLWRQSLSPGAAGSKDTPEGLLLLMTGAGAKDQPLHQPPALERQTTPPSLPAIPSRSPGSPGD